MKPIRPSAADPSARFRWQPFGCCLPLACALAVGAGLRPEVGYGQVPDRGDCPKPSSAQAVNATVPLSPTDVSLSSQSSKAAMPWSGSLLLCGGSVLPPAIRDRFFELGGAERGALVVIPTASPRSDGGDYSFWVDYWHDYRWASVAVVHANAPVEAHRESSLDALRSATAVWISGGDQSRLADRFNGTPVLKELTLLLERGGVVGGTSAGAAICSETMISGGRTEPTFKTGFGFLPGVMIDQHFVAKNRMERLSKGVHHQRGLTGLGIDESTGILIRGRTAEVLGAGQVHWYRAAAEGDSLEHRTQGPFNPDRTFRDGAVLELAELSLLR